MRTRLLIVFCAAHFARPANPIRLASTQTAFPPITVCLDQVIDLFVTNSSVVFFADEIQQLPWTDSLLKLMRKPRFVLAKRPAGLVFGFYVLFPELSATYRPFFADKMHSRSRFLLVWHNRTDTAAVRSLFDDFWHHHRVNVVAMTAHDDRFRFLAFDPYSPGKCGLVGDPYVIAEWSWLQRRFSADTPWFPRKLRNLAGCPLVAIGTHQPPDNVMQYNGTWRAKGVGQKILRVAEQYVNFTSVVVGTQLNVSLDHLWYYFDREMGHIFDAVDHEWADFAFGWYSYANMEIKNFDATFELGRVSSIDCFGWAVPYRAGNKPPNATYYVNEFNYLTWGLIALTLSVCSALFRATSRRSAVASTLVALQTFLERPIRSTHVHQEMASFKMAFVNFCFYSLVVSTAYKASFSSFLSVPNQGREFKSVKDILNSTLRVRGSPTMRSIIADSAGHTDMGKAILRRFRVHGPCDYAQIMRRMVRERDIALLSVKRKMFYYSIPEAKRIRVKIPFRFIPGCLVRPHTTHFLFKKGSHLIEPFNVVLNRLFEAGITTYWILHLGTNRVLPLERLKGRTLKLAFLKEPLLLLVLGYALAAFVFLGEVALAKRSRATVDKVK